ncbi:TPA: type VI secretion system baseplate subunit TssF [Salmonella enterica subsp. houtenae serovar 43:z4,z32:-]|uniref:Type VI secretion system baseplate subunit TssF n=3 Tax=Salmonella enterica TaxID=28901 RepID=A0A5V1J2R6_SALER|nr:type VI secretion system baseplate subunit TssF [Salmonella enterica]EDX4413402.1 type VI secretion system baseplate subunit TssF [Salmonella enterica subsp. houtenae serovar 44:z36,[z38]:-]HAC6493931.1 type VI secretion system baseplate subunit TssF [Salmonella enterica subsp. houtenae serovar 44:z36[z38]:-]HAF0296806.1 type VI secretion system baseplate subunit TssF [Salmonella enterica subsp. houtenae serovar 43:z4,z32:-]AXD28661.1 type VI secretion system baseplate subunit TssF [Salmonel
MTSEERYYREELDYIRRYARLLAQENPRLDAFLGSKNADPGVERLMEGFAFLSGRLREKIEDTFPEITVPLISRQCPNYLRTVPAMTVIEYTPDNTLTAPVIVPRNAQVMNTPRKNTIEEEDYLLPGGADDLPEEEAPPCIFTLCRDIRLLPLCISEVNNRSTPAQGIIDITFTPLPGGRITVSDLNGISLWLSDGDDASRQDIYLWLCRHQREAEVIVGGRHYPQPELALKPSGFSDNESLLPQPEKHHNGYRVMQDWFCFREAFFFFELSGVALPDSAITRPFTLRLRFDQPLPETVCLNRHALRLHCAPAVNLFIHDAVPITPVSPHQEYPLQASQPWPDYFDIFRVNSVQGQEHHTFREEDLDGLSRRSSAHHWLSSDHFPRPLEYHRERRIIYWQHIMRRSLLSEQTDHFISLRHSDNSIPDTTLTGREPVQISLTCTNREQPCLLAPGDICIPVGQNASVASLRNVTVPTKPIPPVPDGPLHWSLLNTLSLNYLTMNDVEALRDILRTFDRAAIHTPFCARLSPEKLNALERLETRPGDRIFRGVAVRGLSSTLYVNPQPFSGKGEMHQLGTVLSHFFALYASTNSWHMLTMVNTHTQETWRWTERTGQFPVM